MLTDVASMIFYRFTHCTVENLSPSHDYQFRVIAENLYGRSDPCEPSSLVQTVTEQEGRRKKGLGDADGMNQQLPIAITYVTLVFIKFYFKSRWIKYKNSCRKDICVAIFSQQILNRLR